MAQAYTQAQIKALIDEKITTNGTHAIVGGLLNAVLQVMADRLGIGFDLMGIATPGSSGTNPGSSPSTPRVYIAGVGSYPNFANTEVGPGHLGIFVWDGSDWSYNVIDTGAWFEVETLPDGGLEMTFYDCANEDGKTIKINADVSALGNSKSEGISAWWAARAQERLDDIQGWSQTLDTVNTSPSTIRPIEAGKVIDTFSANVTSLMFGTEDGEYMTVNASDLPYTVPETFVRVKTASGTKCNVTIHVRGQINAPGNINLNTEDLVFNDLEQIQFADRQYNSETPEGMGYIILRKDKTFAEQITDKSNTIFEIRYDFDLNADVEMAPGCVLYFNGGSINGTYQLIGNGTRISGYYNNRFNVIKSGTWYYPKAKDYNEDFDYIVETQADYEVLFGKINADSKSSIKVLLRNNFFVSPQLASAHTISGKSVSIYGDNATIMAYNKELKELYIDTVNGYDRYDLSEVWENNIPAFPALLSKDGEYVPFNFVSIIPFAYPTIVDAGERIAKVSFNTAYQFLANKNAAFFKYSYLRFSSCWRDTKAKVLYSDSTYIYFEYLTAEQNALYTDGFDTEYANRKSYGYPVIRIYNIPGYDGVSINGDKILSVPTNIDVTRVVLKDSSMIFEHCPSVILQGLNLIGSAPYNADFEDNLASGMIKIYQDSQETSLSIRDCKSNGICSHLIANLNSSRFDYFLVENCNLLLHFNLIRIGAANDYIVRNNRISGSKNSFCCANALVSGSNRNVTIHDNEVINAGYNFIESTEMNIATENALSGKIYSNHIYCTKDFLESREHFYLEDGGGIYVCNRSDATFEIFDNVIHDIPVPVGIYLDGGSSNVSVQKNLVYKTRIGINVNGEENPKRPALACNINIAINSNLIGNRCNITSQTLADNNCSFASNFLLQDVLKDKPFNGIGKPLNFTHSGTKIIYSRYMDGGVIIPAVNVEFYNLVSSFIKQTENSTAPNSYISEKESGWLQINAQLNRFRFFMATGQNNACRFKINALVPLADLQFGFDLVVPSINNTVHIAMVKGVAYIEEIGNNAFKHLTYGYVVTADDGYSCDLYLKFEDDDLYWNHYATITNVTFGSVVDTNTGSSLPVEYNSLYIEGYTTPQYIDYTKTNIVRKNSVGPSANRPKEPYLGCEYLDTTLGMKIWYNGTRWVDTMGRTPGQHSGDIAEMPKFLQGTGHITPTANDYGYPFLVIDDDTIPLGTIMLYWNGNAGNGGAWVDSNGTVKLTNP